MHKSVFALAVAFSLIGFSAQSASLDVDGVWLTESKTGVVKIEDCGNGSPCGKLVWIDSPSPNDQFDDQNPDPTLRAQPILGLQMIWGFEQKGSAWKRGKIYSPEEGKTYRSSIALQADGTLKVKGCIGPFCQSQIWTKVDPDAELSSE